MLGGLTVTAVVFHGPLLRWVVDRGARYFAEKEGLRLEWKLGGNIVSGFTIQGLKVGGPEGMALKNIEWGKAGADYDLWALWRQGTGHFLNSLELADATVEIDARPKPGKTPEPEPAKSSGPPPDVWMKRIDLRNITARIVTETGVMTLKHFTLLLDAAGPGVLEIGELDVPSAGVHLENVKGTTAMEGRTIVLTDVAVMPELVVARLSAGLAEVGKGVLPFELRVRSGPAVVEAKGRAEELGGNMAVDATVEVTGLGTAEVARFVKLPEGLAATVNALKIQVAGPVAEPQKLAATLTLDAGPVTMPEVKIDTVKLGAGLKAGKVTLESLTVGAGKNTVAVTGTAELPAKWPDAAQAGAEVAWKLDAPEIQSLLQGKADVTGAVRGQGTARVEKGALAGAKASLEATGLMISQKPVERVTVEAAATADVVTLESLTARLDVANTATVTGTMGLKGRQPVEAAWDISLGGLAAVVKWAGVKDQPGPEAGTLTAKGHAKADLADVQEKIYTRAEAAGTVKADGIVWQKAGLEQAEVDFSVQGGRADVKQLAVRLNEKNQLTLHGGMGLDEAGAFDAEVNGDFAQLADFGGWLALAKAPALLAGQAKLAWKGSGKLSTKEVSGGGSLAVDGLKLAGRPQTFSLALETNHEGRKAEITQLRAAADQFRVEAAASVSDTDLEVTRLALFAAKDRLLEGTLSVPLALAAQPPIDAARPLHAHLKAERLELATLAGLAGKKLPVSGRAGLSLDLDGPLPEVAGGLAVTLDDVRAEATAKKLGPATVRLQATLGGGRLSAALNATQPPLQPVLVTAELPFVVDAVMKKPDSLLDAPLKARASMADSDLAVVRQFAPMIAELQGRLGFEVKADGPVRAPRLSGGIHATVPQARFTNPAIPEAKDLSAKLTFQDRLVKIDDISATLAGGGVKLGGTIDLAKQEDPAFDIRLQATEALVIRDESLSQRANADVTLRGRYSKAEVAGRVELVRGRVFKEIEFLPLSLPNQLPPPPAPARRPAPSAPAKPFDQWSIAVDVVTKDQIRLLGNVLNGGVIVDLHARGTPVTPTLEGTVTLDQARLQLPFSRLAITRGVVTFTKERSFDPELDIVGDALVSQHQVSLYAYGPALSPKVRFTSSPPLPEGDIATLLATGSTAGDLSSSQGEAANKAAFLFISQTYRKMFKKASTSRYDEEPPKLSFSFSPLSTGGSKRSITATYELTPKIQAVGTVNEGGGFRGLLYYLIRFH